MTKNIQYRGHCPICGRVQAVYKGTMAHHGYNVYGKGYGGMFVGSCEASKLYQPLERSRAGCDDFCERLEAEAVQFDALADSYASGESHPLETGPVMGSMIPWHKGDDYQRAHTIEIECFKLRRKAELLRAHIKFLQDLADARHGQNLIEVDRNVRPEHIEKGELREQGSRVLTCERVEGARVYYSFVRGNGKKVQSWHGTALWRRLPKIEEEA